MITYETNVKEDKSWRIKWETRKRSVRIAQNKNCAASRL